jgi:hypothetical protein
LTSGFAKVLTSVWTLGSIIVAQSGTPFWVIDNRPLTAGGDYNHDGVAYDVPNAPSFGCHVSYGRSNYISGLFTAADFSAPAPGTEGSEPRNCYRNPGMVNVDASVAKNTHLPWIGEAGNVQLRFDFLNLFNHSNLGPVDPLMGDGNFGKVTSALGARTTSTEREDLLLRSVDPRDGGEPNATPSARRLFSRSLARI